MNAPHLRTQLFIDGSWHDGAGGKTFAVTDPATGDHLADVASGTAQDAISACSAADIAQRSWAGVAPRERAEILRRCWATLIDHQQELADLIVREQGKPLADATGEIAYAAEFFRWNSEEAVRIHGSLSVAPSDGDELTTVFSADASPAPRPTTAAIARRTTSAYRCSAPRTPTAFGVGWLRPRRRFDRSGITMRRG